MGLFNVHWAKMKETKDMFVYLIGFDYASIIHNKHRFGLKGHSDLFSIFIFMNPVNIQHII